MFTRCVCILISSQALAQSDDVEPLSASQPSDPTVALAVTGSPDGALVTLTGPGFQREGRLPWVADGLTTGSYVVTVTREGYEPLEWSDVIAPGGFEHVVAALEPIVPRPLRAGEPMRCVPRPPRSGRSQAEQDEFDERRALEQIEELKRIAASSDEDDELRFKLAERYWELFCITRRKELAPTEPADHRGSEMYRRAVVGLFEGLLHGSPDYARNDEVLFNLASNFQAVGETDRALGRYAELIDRYPTSLFAAAARLALNQGRIAAERAVRSTDPRTRTRALSELGWCDFSSGDLERSSLRFRQVMARDQLLAGEGLRGLVSTLVKQRRFSEARAALKARERSSELNWLNRMVDRASRE
ncbi:MAG: hypothetical protein Q8S33_00615 [Myxococcales bacterium]|nr:hypothetical protein [Myxococcales bacterium]